MWTNPNAIRNVWFLFISLLPLTISAAPDVNSVMLPPPYHVSVFQVIICSASSRPYIKFYTKMFLSGQNTCHLYGSRQTAKRTSNGLTSYLLNAMVIVLKAVEKFYHMSSRYLQLLPSWHGHFFQVKLKMLRTNILG